MSKHSRDAEDDEISLHAHVKRMKLENNNYNDVAQMSDVNTLAMRYLQPNPPPQHTNTNDFNLQQMNQLLNRLHAGRTQRQYLKAAAANPVASHNQNSTNNSGESTMTETYEMDEE